MIESERATTRRLLIDHLKKQLAEGQIKAMESRLLMELLKEEEDDAEIVAQEGTSVLKGEDLPFMSGSVVSLPRK